MPVKYYRICKLSRVFVMSCLCDVPAESTMSGNAVLWEASRLIQREGTDNLQRLCNSDRGAFRGDGAGVGRRHFVMEADDGETEEGDDVLGAEDAFVVHVDVEKLMERLNVANAPVLWAGANNAIEAGAPPSGAGGVQAKRAIGRSDGAEINVRAAIAWKGDLDARVGLAGDLRGGVETGV